MREPRGRALASALGMLASVLIMSACRPAPLAVQIPIDARARAGLAVIQPPAATTRLFAIDFADHTTNPLLTTVPDVGSSQRLTITVLYFERALDDLGLKAGPIDQVAATDPGRSLDSLAPDAIRSVAVEGGALGAFATEPALPPEVARLRVPPLPSPCKDWKANPFPLGGELLYAGGVALTSTSALLVVASDVGSQAQAYAVDRNGARRLDGLLPDFSPVVTASAAFMARGHVARTPDGRIYVSGTVLSLGTPQIYAGDLSSGFRPLTGDPDDSPIYGIAAGQTEPEPTLYVMHQSCALEALAGGHWTKLGQIALPGGGCGLFSAGVVWSAPGDLYSLESAELQADSLGHFSGGAATIEVPPPTGGFLTAVATVPGIGTFAGSWLGSVFRRSDNGSWQELSTAFVDAASSFVPYTGGMLIGAAGGRLLQYDAGRDVFCTQEALSLIVALKFVMPVPGGLLIAGSRDPNDVETGPLDVRAAFVQPLP